MCGENIMSSGMVRKLVTAYEGGGMNVRDEEHSGKIFVKLHDSVVYNIVDN